MQQSVALENYLEEVKTELAEIQLFKPKHNLPHNERKAIKDLKNNHDINIKTKEPQQSLWAGMIKLKRGRFNLTIQTTIDLSKKQW